MTRDDILPRVLEGLRSAKQLRPTVYAEIEGQERPCEFGILRLQGDAREQSITLFHEGRTAGRQNRTMRLVRIWYASEIWLTEGQRNPTPGHRPPAGVKHLEGLLIAQIEAKAPFTENYRVYEMIRSERGVVEELRDLHAEGEGGFAGGLAWVCGWYSRCLTQQATSTLSALGMRPFLELDPDQEVQR